MVLKKKLVFLIFGTVLCSCSEERSSIPKSDYVARSGEAIFAKECASCHGMDGKLCASGAKDLSISQMDSLGIARIIQKGKGAMPPQESKFVTGEELSNTVTYVQSLKE